MVEALTPKQISTLEAKLNTDADSLISTFLQQEDLDDQINTLKAFIEMKNSSIAELYEQNSQFFAAGIHGARELESSAYTFKEEAKAIKDQLQDELFKYEMVIEETQSIRNRICSINSQIEAIDECQILIQQLQSINDELDAGHYYIAAIRALEFSDYDSFLSRATIITSLQQDALKILEYCELETEELLKPWLLDFRQSCENFGKQLLYSNSYQHFDNRPLYEAYMVKKLLGKLPDFQKFYENRRIQQLDTLCSSYPIDMPLISKIQSLFSNFDVHSSIRINET